MDSIKWRDEFNIGIPKIDEQHQRLVKIINDLAANINPENIFDTVMQMSKYADEHFEMEEDMILGCCPDQLKEHREQHLIFRQKTSELAGLDYTKGEHSLDAFNYLCQWLANHILTVDMKYKYCFISGYKNKQESE